MAELLLLAGNQRHHSILPTILLSAIRDIISTTSFYTKTFIFSSFSSKYSRHPPLTATTARVEVLPAASRDQSYSAAQFGHHFASALLACHTRLPPSRDRPFESFEPLLLYCEASQRAQVAFQSIARPPPTKSPITRTRNLLRNTVFLRFRRLVKRVGLCQKLLPATSQTIIFQAWSGTIVRRPQASIGYSQKRHRNTTETATAAMAQAQDVMRRYVARSVCSPLHYQALPVYS